MQGFWREHPFKLRAVRLFAVACGLLLAIPLSRSNILSRACADEPAAASSSANLDQLLLELDDDSFEVRRRAQRQLIALGEPALSGLRQAIESPSAEVRARAREIVRQIEHERLLREFRRLNRPADDASVDLEEGLVLAAQVVDPSARREPIAEALDALAERVRKRLPVAPKDADPREAVEALRQVLFVEEGFDGNRNDYDNPANSSLAHVLTTKRGLPILLSQVVIAVGRRLELPLVGLALPGRFMVKYDNQQAKAAAQRIVLVIDPFEAGKILTLDELREFLPDLSANSEAIKRLLEPAGNRATLVRVLNNLSNAYVNKEDYRRAGEVDVYREVLFASSDPAAE